MILIGNIVEEIRIKLQAYFDAVGRDPNPPDGVGGTGLPDNVVLGNVSLVDAFNAGDPNIQDNLVISLVSIEEEKTLRYTKISTVIPAANPNDSRVVNHNPVVFLNIYLLFSSHNRDYKASLNQLSAVVNFFQRQQVYSGSEINSPTLDQLVFELVTTNFEQMNHLWGVLGGKYIPSALYKVRLLPHEDIPALEGSGRILRERANSNAV